MDARRLFLSGCLLFLILACDMPGARAQETTAAPTATTTPALPDDHAEDAWEEKQAELLRRGDELLLKQGQPEAAIREAFDPIIEAYESRHDAADTVYFCARTTAETLLYLTGLAAKQDHGESGKNGIALSSTWAYAHYGKAYALIELNRFDEAAVALDRALELSPYNPQFLTERGYVYRSTGEWQKMLESNRSALEFVDITSPDDRRDAERARALRGEGFALIELGQLEEAEKSFRKSLKLERGNEIALNELEYIKQLRKHSK